MEKCSICCQEADVDFLKRCESCFRNYVMNVKDSQFRAGILKAGYTVTAAHYDDITRRRLGPDGKVYRDRGRRSISMGASSRDSG